MFLTVKEAAIILQMEPYQVYYLLLMGEIEAVALSGRGADQRKVWRVFADAVDDYDKRHPERKIIKPADNFIYSGNSGYLFYRVPDCLPLDTRRETAGVERRRGQMVRRAGGSDKILLQKLKSLDQLELFSV